MPLARSGFLAALCLSLTSGAGLLAAPRLSLSAQAPVATDTGVVADSLRLFYVGHAIGYEHYRVSSDPSGFVATADFDYVDRGRRLHMVDTMRMRSDYSPRRLHIWRVTDTSATAVVRVDVSGLQARVTGPGGTGAVTLPPTAFVVAGDQPVSQHLLLLRYWLSHGRPPSLAVVPGGPTNTVAISYRGRTTLTLDGQALTFTRYAVDGVVWGVESVWIDSAGRLAVVTSGGGGGLEFEAIRDALTPLYTRIMDVVIHDRMSDLAAISRRVRPVASGAVALVGGTLIDGTGSPAIPNATVVVRDGRIVAAGPAGQVRIPADAMRFDARGKTIMPGLWNTHVHLHQMEWLPVYMAAGETTVRDMGNEIDFELALRRAVQSGDAIGPTLVLAGLVDGGGPNAFGAVTADMPDEGRAVVDRYHALGFPQIKLYDLLQPDVVGAITREAHRLGMTVTGHVPRALGMFVTIDSGQDQIAHIPIRGVAGSDSVRRQVAFVAAHHVAIDPTASWGDLLRHSIAEPVTDIIPQVPDLPPVLRQRIAGMGAPTDTAHAHANQRNMLGVLHELHVAGVPLLPGTDEGVPGFSLYRELQLYTMAGVSNMDAILAATSVSAHALGMSDRVGTIRPGLEADLIVLDGNPLDNITNVSRVRFVMKHGVLYRDADIWRAVGFTPPQ